MDKENPKSEAKRTWTRRTRMLIPEVPPDVFDPNLISEIKQRGEETMTPYSALKAFGLEVDEKQTDFLNSVLADSDPQLFLHLEEITQFKCKDIDRFIKATLDNRFRILEIAAIPFETKEAILKNASLFLSEIALQKRAEEWKK